MNFDPSRIDLSILKNRAYNLRWATVPEGVIPLTAADPDFKCAPVILEAIEKHVKDGYFSYAPSEGLPEFKQALSTFLKDKRNVSISTQNILPLDYLTCKTILKPTDEAIIFDPVDFLFQYSIEKVGAKAVRFSIPQSSEKIDFNQIEKLITAKTKLICLCNPLNPTGKVFSKEELQTLGEIAVKHNIFILSDEIWSDIVFKPAVFTSIASINEEISNQTILVTGFSKSYGLAGLRIGVIATQNRQLFQNIFETSLHQSTIHGANSIGQIAAAAALTDAQDWLSGFIAHLQNMRDLLTSRINSISGLSTISPDGCYVSFINIQKTGMNSENISNHLLKNAKVAVVPGLPKWFGEGATGHIRISFATSEEVLNEALNRIEKAL